MSKVRRIGEGVVSATASPHAAGRMGVVPSPDPIGRPRDAEGYTMTRRQSAGPAKAGEAKSGVSPTPRDNVPIPVQLPVDVTGETNLDVPPLPPGVNPHVAAYVSGRLLNQLAFHLQQAWFLPTDRDQVEAVAQISNRLGRTVREIVPVALREQLQGDVNRWAESMLEAIRSDWHHDDLADCNSKLLATHGDASPIEARADYLLFVDAELSSLREAILAPLSDIPRLCLHLGECIDRGIRPKNIHLSLDSIRDPPGPPTACGPGGVKRLSPDQIRGREVVRRTGYVLATRSVRPGEVPPADDWLEQVRQVLGELDILRIPSPVASVPKRGGENTDDGDAVEKLDGAVLAALASGMPGVDNHVEAARVAEDRADVEIAQESVAPDQIAVTDSAKPATVGEGSRDDSTATAEPSADQAVGPANSSRKPRYLGIILDERRFHVRRAGKGGIVDLSGKYLLWGLLLKLIEMRDVFCPRERLRIVWERYGNEKEPEDGTINDAVSTLGKALKPLDLKVRAKRNIGWRLLDISQ